ncbi:hypothetical protein [Vibrio alginolyticus]|uniref:hypothetical protein n=1 Tax=Vibrio TaxID=662 RepID=UPI0006CA6356|nr:hypothetical protein [Vibrio alginolyticus]KPM97530.1 hypothetical protein AOG25_13745 [Vibrio alginolyticus]CAH7194487.1 conserved hypothetical protein [Vibrio chagasii]CAH7362303.1 conserved hypothetical protein [Vibrio chagasii]
MTRVPTEKLVDFIEENPELQLKDSEPAFAWGGYCFVYGYSIFANPYRNNESDGDLYELWKEGWKYAKELTQTEPAPEG